MKKINLDFKKIVFPFVITSIFVILLSLGIFLNNLRVVNTTEPYSILKDVSNTQNTLLKYSILIDSTSGFLGSNDGTTISEVSPLFGNIDWENKTKDWNNLPLIDNFDLDYSTNYNTYSYIKGSWSLDKGVQEFIDNLNEGKYVYFQAKNNSMKFVFFIWSKKDNRMFVVFTH